MSDNLEEDWKDLQPVRNTRPESPPEPPPVPPEPPSLDECAKGIYDALTILSQIDNTSYKPALKVVLTYGGRHIEKAFGAIDPTDSANLRTTLRACLDAITESLNEEIQYKIQLVKERLDRSVQQREECLKEFDRLNELVQGRQTSAPRGRQ